MPKPYRHILIIRLSALGDVAMTVPVLRAFKAQYPHVQLTVLTRPFFKPLFEEFDNLRVFTAHFNAENKGVNGLFKLSKQLSKLDFDAVADVHNVLRTRLLKLFLVGRPFAHIDKGRAEKYALIQGQKFEPLKTTHQRYADVFDKLGYPIELSKPVFPDKKPLSAPAQKFIEDNHKTIIGIAPFAQHTSKEYPLELMEQVIGTLSKSKQYTMLLFGGGKHEIKVLDGMEAQYDGVHNVAGKLSFKEELKLIAHLDLMVSMDSGNGHLAAMFGVPVVTLWGVTHPFAGFAPFYQNPENSLLSDRIKFPKIPTSVYGNKYPKGYERAMESILPERVVAKIEEVLSKRFQA